MMGGSPAGESAVRRRTGMNISRRFLACALGLAMLPRAASHAAEPLVLSPPLHHLRADGPREWDEFPETADAPFLELRFAAQANSEEQTLSLRQQDVKQGWRVSLNGQPLGDLVRDENDMRIYLPVPAGVLRAGENVLRIEPQGRHAAPDDIRVGELVLWNQPRQDVLSVARLEVHVRDADQGDALPCRITILDAHGALQSVGAQSNQQLAVRPGTVYSANGRAQFGLPAGNYTVVAGRGFEYSLARSDVHVTAGDPVRCELSIRREVPTAGYVACDTHVHTLTFSGHGDATAEERMITLAGEGIELPIATDHNVNIDHGPLARKMDLHKYFTPVIGNEVTTRTGHFNVFPVAPGAPPPDASSSDWAVTLAAIHRTPGIKAVILNHARDIHSGTRPFGPENFNDAAAVNLHDWPMRFNAMEVVNSGANQSDILQLFQDWMTLLNRGHRVTPVGSSDSHDVSRHFVGQGRTYIRCRDDDPGDIHVDEAVASFLQGRVMVSYGLLTQITVDDKYGSGELAAVPDSQVRVTVRVLAPSWITADRVLLFANGELIRDKVVPSPADPALPPGVKFQATWSLDRPGHDVHLVAIGLGPGVPGLHWRTAKPYQPTSPAWQAQVLGCSGAVWLDADGDGRATPAVDYARKLVQQSQGNWQKLVAALAPYDAAVAAQAAQLFQAGGGELMTAEAEQVLNGAAPATRTGVRQYLAAWRENQIAGQ
jgi:hypothetical protein